LQDKRLQQRGEYEWLLEPDGSMKVPAIIYASREQLEEMDRQVLSQLTNVAALPGIYQAVYAMPDAHWGYGFPIGGVAAFDPRRGGVVSAGGVGFDISCGVRTMLTGLTADEVRAVKFPLADSLFREIPAGVGSTGHLQMRPKEMDKMLVGGAQWAVSRGYGDAADLERIEDCGCISGARPEMVSSRAKKRQQEQVGTLGSGNHYLEVQVIEQIYQFDLARQLGLREGEVAVSLHCGSRGLGHQIGTEFLRLMLTRAAAYGIMLPDRELACVPVESPEGQQYLGAMRAAVNCALANRQVLTHLVRRVFARFFPVAALPLLYDVSHNTCRLETLTLPGGGEKDLYVHRKGATRALPPGHPDIAADLRSCGQPVLIGGSMGTSSYVLAGMPGAENRAFSSSCHGAGRVMSRRQATRRWRGKEVVTRLEEQGIVVRGGSYRGLAEEAPGAYKDVSLVVETTEAAGLARRVARLSPLVCIKG